MTIQDAAREYKSFPALVTATDEEQGIVEAIFAVMGNIDEGKDIVHPGSFTKTFSERGLKVRVLDHHNSGSILNVIGKPLELRELSRNELPTGLLQRYPEATGGAFAKVQMLMDTPEGRGAFIRLRDKAVDEWSFGYEVMDADFSKALRGDKEITVRNLRTLRLFEVSPVIWGMNQATATIGAKAEADDDADGDPDETKAVMKAEGDGEAALDAPKALDVLVDGASVELTDETTKAILNVLNGITAPAGQAATDDANDDTQAGPDAKSAPPTSPTLEQMEALLFEIELLEV